MPSHAPEPDAAATRSGDPPAGGGGFVVVVPARNAAATLPACLAGIAASEVKPAEVVVVDDGSTDATAEIARAAGARVIVPEGAPVGPGRARDLAVAETAAGGVPLVALVDADVVVHPAALGRLAEELATPGVVASFGSYDDAPPAPAVASRYANLRHHFVHQQAGGEAASFWAGLGMVRRDAWNAVGGFGHRYDRPAIEDIDLGRRLVAAGGRVRCRPDAQATHLKAWTLRQLWRTDIFQRALPWSKLLIEEPALTPAGGGAEGAKLNTGRRDQLSALAVWGAGAALLAGLFVSPWLLAAAAVLAAAWGVLNRGLLGLFSRAGGVPLLLGGGALHALHHAYASAVFGCVLLRHRWRAGPLAVGAAGVVVLGLAAAAAAALVLWAVSPVWLNARLQSLNHDGGPDPFGPAAVAALQHRAALSLGLLLPVLAVALLAGARAAVGVLADLPGCLRAVVRPLRRRWVALGVGALTAALALRIAGQSGQVLRTDEALTFLMHGHASPLKTLAVWEDSNNHLLHSVLLWLSVNLFGDAAAAIRLPAACATVLLVPAVVLGLRPHLGLRPALLAAAAFAGSGYAVDMGTNARGYPLVVLATAVLLALVPAVRAGRPAGIALASVAAAAGAWAVPVMLLPFAAAVGMVVLPAGRATGGAPAPGPGWIDRTKRAAWLSAGTGVCTALCWTPPLLTLGLTGKQSGSGVVQETLSEFPLQERGLALARNLAAGFEQMTFPAPTAVQAALFGLVLLGVALCLRKRGPARAFTLAAVAGPLAVVLAVGVAPMPVWTLGFALPALLGFAAVPLAAVIRLAGPRARWPIAAAAAACFAVPASFFAMSAYPAVWPWYVGYRDAPEAAAVLGPLLEEAAAEGRPVFVVPGPVRIAPLERELRNWRALEGRPTPAWQWLLPPRGDASEAPPPGAWMVTISEDGELPDRMQARLSQWDPTPGRRFELPGSELWLLQAAAPRTVGDSAPKP